jgi:hypothetical protein
MPDPTPPRHTDRTSIHYCMLLLKDFDTLLNVRHYWDGEAKQRFCLELHALQFERERLLPKDDRTSNLTLGDALAYQPGDYREAARRSEPQVSNGEEQDDA